jgi:hypothetical protein
MKTPWGILYEFGNPLGVKLISMGFKTFKGVTKGIKYQII